MPYHVILIEFKTLVILEVKDILVSHKILRKMTSYLFFHLGSHIISFPWRRSISVRLCDFGLRRVDHCAFFFASSKLRSRGYYCRVGVEKLAPESSALSGLLSADVTTSVDKCKQKWDDGRKGEDTLEFHPIDTCSSFGGASIGPSDRVTRCPIQSRLQQKWNAAEPRWETPESE